MGIDIRRSGGAKSIHSFPNSTLFSENCMHSTGWDISDKEKWVETGVINLTREREREEEEEHSKSSFTHTPKTPTENKITQRITTTFDRIIFAWKKERSMGRRIVKTWPWIGHELDMRSKIYNVLYFLSVSRQSYTTQHNWWNNKNRP